MVVVPGSPQSSQCLWVVTPQSVVKMFKIQNLCLYSTRRYFGRAGADNAIHFALGTFQIFFSPTQISSFFLSIFNRTQNVPHSDEKSICNIGRIIWVRCTLTD